MVVHHLDTFVSDHKPLWIDLHPLPERRRRHKLFRFEDMWRSNPGCEDIITFAWTSTPRGLTMVQVQTKISRCRTELMKWSRLQFGNVVRQLKEKKKELHRA